MLLRRALGLAATFAMVHLTVTGGTFECARIADTGVAAGMGAAASGANVSAHGAATAGMANHTNAPGHGEHLTTAQQPDDGAPPCDAPIARGCCHAMASCTTVAAFAAVTTVAPAWYAAPELTGLLVDAPASAVRVPDPPPPKA